MADLTTSGTIQYSVHSPNPYLLKHLDRLLPDWSPIPAASVLLVLQQCPYSLLQRTVETEAYKNLLRQRFLDFGNPIASELARAGFLVELFDPATGMPMRSQPGSIRLDDVAMVRSILSYSVINRGGCSIVLHPHWGSAVYPSTVVSSAPPQVVEAILKQSYSSTLANG